MVAIKTLMKNHLKPKNEEISQSIARTVISLIITISLITLEIIDVIPAYLLAGYSIFSIIHLFVVVSNTKFKRWRIIFTIWTDITLTTIMLYFINEIGTFFFPLYFWFIMGNGLRFGNFYLIISSLYTITIFFILININVYWSSHPYISYGILTSLLILPSFFYVLINRLQDAQQQLKFQLKESRHLAHFDTLTKIPNRHYLLQTLAQYQVEKKPITLFFIDLDGFKVVNDTLGHYIGDQVLIEVAQRLTNLMKDNHFVARLGGDEFAYITQNTETQNIKKLAEEIVHQLQKPYLTKTVESISASVGVTSAREFQTADILKSSDSAMYKAKQMGKNQYFYSL